MSRPVIATGAHHSVQHTIFCTVSKHAQFPSTTAFVVPWPLILVCFCVLTPARSVCILAVSPRVSGGRALAALSAEIKWLQRRSRLGGGLVLCT